MDSEDEDYVFFGTPLPEIEDEATLRKKAAKELQVRDEKGRQRFHGAFTGGFSAGYFNTVGTKEGWAPSSFISSRDKVADRVQQNPEDFMDEEDLGEFGIATRKIHTTTNFQDKTEGRTQKRNYIDADAVIPGEAPLKDIVKPVRESIGIIILRKLGWREGQGIGPRVKKNAKMKVYGCSPFPETSTLEEEDPMAASFTFAPKDIESMSYKSKDNYFGLGYTGLSKQSVLNAPIDLFSPTSTKSWLSKDKKKLKISGQAFGVGAFENEDADIYGKDDMSQYDFSELAPTKSENSNKTTESSNYEKYQGVLEGFHLAVQPPSVKEHYPPPTLPSNFKPVHLKTVCSTPKNTNISQSRHPLSASDRSLIIGERKFQKASLNEEMKKSDFEPVPSSSFSSITSSNFRPFSCDIAKQNRYKEYLELKQSGDISKFNQPSSMTEWEKQQEVEEFSKASVFFKPLSNALSSRFESRSQLSAEHEVMAALEKIKKEKEGKQVIVKKNLVGKSNRKTFEWHPVPLLCKRMNVPNPFPNSGSGGTQSVSQPKSVFDHLAFISEKPPSSGQANISDPPTSNILPEKSEKTNTDISNEIQKEVSDNTVTKNSSEKTTDSLSEAQRPTMDFFKDIFENSSSDEDSADEEKTKISDEETSKKEGPEFMNTEDVLEKNTTLHSSLDKRIVNQFSEKSSHNPLVVQNSSTVTKKVGFGVFANLDLDALNQRKPAEKTSHVDISKSENVASKNTLVSNSNDTGTKKNTKVEDTYGPELPPNYSAVDTPVASSSSYVRKHAKSKSSHKHKHHKHKHKKKKKKASKKYSSCSDSDEEELDDVPPSLIIEKMKKLQRKML